MRWLMDVGLCYGERKMNLDLTFMCSEPPSVECATLKIKIPMKTYKHKLAILMLLIFLFFFSNFFFFNCLYFYFFFLSFVVLYFIISDSKISRNNFQNSPLNSFFNISKWNDENFRTQNSIETSEQQKLFSQ